MPYQLTLNDIKSIDNQTNPKSSGYQLTLDDMKSVDAPSAQTKKPTSFLQKAGNLARNYITTPLEELGADVGTGVAQGTRDLLNLVPGVNLPQVPSMQQTFGLPAPNPIDRFITGAASFAPSAITGSGVLRAAGKVAPGVINAADKLSNLATSGAIYGASQSPDHSSLFQRLDNADAGALTNVLVPKIAEEVLKYGAQPVKSAAAVIRNLVRGKGETGQITPQEFEARQAAIPEGINLPIGDVAKSGNLKKTYGATEAIFGSGASEPYEQLNTHIRGVLNQLKNNLTPQGIPQNIDEKAFNDYANSYENALANRKQAYSTLDAEIQNHNNQLQNKKGAFGKDLSIIKTPLRGALSDIYNKLDPLVKSKTGQSQYSDIYGFLKDIDAQPGKPTVKPTIAVNNFEDLDDLRTLINNEYSKNLTPDGKQNRALLNQLRNAVDDTIDKNAEKLGNDLPNLKAAYQNAKNSHLAVLAHEKLGTGKKPPLSPFKKMYDGLSGPTPSVHGFVNSYLGTSGSKSDAANLNNLLDRVSPQTSRQIAAHYLFNPEFEKELNPGKVITRFNKLNDAQKGALFGPYAQNLERLSQLHRISPDVFNVDWVPKTGWTGARALSAAIPASVGGTGIAQGHYGAALAALASPMVAAQGVQRGLRSQFLKDMYLKSLKKGPVNQVPRGTYQALEAALTGNLLNNNRNRK